MTESIVDALEVVQIKIDDGDALLRLGGLNKQAFRGLDAALPVRQPGQRVEVRQALNVLGRRSTLAGILSYYHHVAAFAAAESQLERAAQVGRTVLSVLEIALQAVVRGLRDRRQCVGQMRRWRQRAPGIRAPLNASVRRDHPEGVRNRLDQRSNLSHVLGERARIGGITQHILDPARQQRPIDRLGYEVRRPGFECAVDRGRVLMTGDHDDRHGRQTLLGAQPLAYRVTIHSGHVDVQEDDRDLLR
jgi:hypothetical protein